MTDRRLKLGITCYPTTGGSGIIATEIGLGMARRGHEVHFICYDVPGRLRPHLCRVAFHRVEVHDYPLKHMGPYPLALATKLAEVSAAERLDVLHVHYAVPHATSAYLARQLLGDGAPRVVTSLHGTDVTWVGSDPSLRATTRLALLASDGLTVPSHYLKRTAHDRLELPAATPIEVIPNFVDTAWWRPAPRRADALRHLLPTNGHTEPPPVLIHCSNFRPLKRLEDTVRILAGVRRVVPAVLILVGDGPERPRIEALVSELGLEEAVCFLGMQLDFVSVLQQSDVFLLPSQTEAFGVAALEALSCGVPVVASRVGGIPEVVADGETGLLCEVGDVAAMTEAVLQLVLKPELHARMSAAARASAARWQVEPMMERWEAYYQRILGTRSPQVSG
ncbi:MAG TPA: N-acetyl-alpha-D-glucosaminyl L-malate synthase BshA [Polyangia bacterium]|jgi:N-acetyl-alpha-D-glucosaminyl L-malate synthase BshA